MIARIAAAMVAVAAFMLLRRVGVDIFGARRRSDLAAAAISVTFFATFLGCAIAWQPQPQAPAGAANVATYSVVDTFCRTIRGPIESGAIGSIDFERSGGVGVADDGEISSATRLVIAGWAWDNRGGRPAIAVCPVVDGKVSAVGRALYGARRPDLPTGAQLGGFAIEFFSGQLPRGKHTLGVAVLSRDGTWQHLGKTVTLRIS